MDWGDHTRRQVIRAGSFLSVVGLTGCLRLSEDAGDDSTQSPTESGMSTPTSGEGEDEGQGESEDEDSPTDDDDTTPSSVELITRKEFPGTTIYDPASHEGAFYGRSDTEITRIRLDGQIEWSAPGSIVPSGYSAENGVDFSSGTAFFGFGNFPLGEERPEPGIVVALDKMTGNKQWEFTVEDDGNHGSIPSIAFISSDLLAVGTAVAGGADTREPLVYGLDPSNGNQLWRTSDFPADFITMISAYNSFPYVVMRDGIYRCDPDTGTVTRIQDIHSGVGTPVVVDETVYLPGKTFQAFSLDNERVQWQAEVEGFIYTQPVIDGGQAFVGTRDGYIYAFDTSDGTKQWENRTLSHAEEMAVTSNHLWVGDDSGTLYAFTQQDGEKAYEELQERREKREFAAIEDRLMISPPEKLAEVA